MQLQDDQTYDWTIEPVELNFQNDFHFSCGLDDLAPTHFEPSFVDECFDDFMSPKEFDSFPSFLQVPDVKPVPMAYIVRAPQPRPISPVLEPMQIDSFLDPKFGSQKGPHNFGINLMLTPKWEYEFQLPLNFSQIKMEPQNYPNFGEQSFSSPSIPVKQECPQVPIPERPPEKKVPQCYSSMPEMPREKSLSTTLNTNHFDDYCLRTEPSFREHPKLLDVSRPFSGPKYTEIFAQFGSSLLVDKHPQLSETDLLQIERTGFMYFLKNVKTIVPKIGPWKFQSHVRGSSVNQPYDTDRSYNLVGSKISIRCKVKEWVSGNDLWRMYHYVPGKSSKSRIV